MKIVIDIPDKVYRFITSDFNLLMPLEVSNLFRNGTPLLEVLDSIKGEMLKVTDDDLRDYWHKCDKFVEILDKYGKENNE